MIEFVVFIPMFVYGIFEMIFYIKRGKENDRNE